MKYMLKCLHTGEVIYFASEKVKNDISGRECIVRYISVSITLRHGTNVTALVKVF